MAHERNGNGDLRTPALDTDLLIPFETDAMSRTKSVMIMFNNGDKTDTQMVNVEAGKPVEVKCAL